jgi:hypothetical protein
MLPDSNVTVLSELPMNENRPIEVTLFGIVMEPSELVPLNEFSPIVERMLPGRKVTVVSKVAFWNAELPIEVTVFGTVMDSSELAPLNALLLIAERVLPVSKVTVVSKVAPLNAESPIEVTVFGMNADPTQSGVPLKITTLSLMMNEPPSPHVTISSTANAGTVKKLVVSSARSVATPNLRRDFILIHSSGQLTTSSMWKPRRLGDTAKANPSNAKTAVNGNFLAQMSIEKSLWRQIAKYLDPICKNAPQNSPRVPNRLFTVRNVRTDISSAILHLKLRTCNYFRKLEAVLRHRSHSLQLRETLLHQLLHVFQLR